MGTRAVYTFKDLDDKFHVYKHWDGYPAGAAIFFMNAIPYAWGGTRFEAGDFAAAFIVGNKEKGGGDIYFTKGPKHHGDLEYVYEIYQNSLDGLMIRAAEVRWYESKKRTAQKQIFRGSLVSFILRYGDEETKQRADEHWKLTPKQAA